MKNKNLILNLFLAFALILFLQTSCNAPSGETEEQTDTVAEVVHEEAHEVHWSYEGETGPEHWAEIVQDCSCGGTAQSPIDLVGASKDKALKALQLTYTAHDELEILNNGHSIQVNYPVGDFVIDGVKYSLVQFHFHAGSEHFIAGKQFPMEVHLVHVTPENQIAVIGIMIAEGKENEFFKTFWADMPAEKAEEPVKKALAFDVNKMLPAKKNYYHYVGSLTTPPCTEGVKWFVMKNPIEASAEQIAKISSLMPKNNFRPVQALNDRKIMEF